MSTDTQAVRLLMERLRSVDEHEAEAAIGHLLEQADVGVFERMADELDAALARIEELEKGLRAILEGHACDPEFPETHPWARCTICSPQEKRWPCATVLEARAALGGEDG